jgi:hypothetical protein
VNDRSGSLVRRQQKRWFCAIFFIWHGVCNTLGMVPDRPVPVQGERQ